MTARRDSKGGCPICGRPNTDERGEKLEHFPFCSARCKLVDLAKWLDGEYFVEDAGEEPPRTEGEGSDTDE